MATEMTEGAFTVLATEIEDMSTKELVHMVWDLMDEASREETIEEAKEHGLDE